MLRLEFLYVVTGELGFVKIGICRPPEMPEDAVRIGSIRPIEIVWVVATNGDAHAIELEAHRRLGSSRHHDEWFAIPVERAIRAVEWAAHELGQPLLDVGPHNDAARRAPSGALAIEDFLGRMSVRVAMAMIVLCGAAALLFANRASLIRLWGGGF